MFGDGTRRGRGVEVAVRERERERVIEERALVGSVRWEWIETRLEIYLQS
jgi:hypothetical protein